MRRIEVSGLFAIAILFATGLAGCGQKSGSEKSTEESPSPKVSLAETGPEGRWQGTRTVTDITRVTKGGGVWQGSGVKVGLKQTVVMEFHECTGDPCAGTSTLISVDNKPANDVGSVDYMWDGKVVKLAPWEDNSTFYQCNVEGGKPIPAWKLKIVREENVLNAEFNGDNQIIKLTGPRLSVAEVSQLSKADTYEKALANCSDVTLADAQAAFGTPQRQELHQDVLMTRVE